MTSLLTHSHILLPSHNLLFVTTPEPRLSQLRLRHGRRFLAAFCASSPTRTSVDSRKQRKSNADLCNDLREFVSEIGLPDGHVPSLKELSQHGRQDLANIVRRRGYKLIRELLAASQEIKVSESDVEGSLTEAEVNKEENELTASQEIKLSDSHVEDILTEDAADTAEDELTASQEIKVSDSHVDWSLTEDEANTSEDELTASQEIKISDSYVDWSLTEDEANTSEDELTASQEIKISDSYVDWSLTEDEANTLEDELRASQEIRVSDYHVEGSLTEDEACKAEDELTGLDENGKELTEYMLSPHEDMLGEGSTQASLQEKVTKFIQSGELEEIDGCEEPSNQALCESDSGSLENGSILTTQLVNSASQLSNITSNDQVATDEAANTDKDLEVEIITEEDQAEINRIKVMLHTKELELSQLKEQIEKNKQALSELQAKAETEINKAQQLLLDKDAELLAAEESLSGLKQVQIEYWGEGETVQVAGSFNGWHHGVTLDPQPSSNITDPVELRNTRLWRSMLWLYPGIYEIKFIVDGKWMIDPMKEVVTRGSIHNNVLRVDR